ncbi:MAG: acetate kinase [Oscillospiraceae bacterium]|nr:acetate kinase [Oscillospiraceae bacterium]
MKILVINAGSSSLKYQLINMEDESVLAKGLCERIGIGGLIKHTAGEHTASCEIDFPTHAEAFAEVVKQLSTGERAVISDVGEISAVGHRVVQGGEYFSESALITEDMLKKLEELNPLAPLHNPANIMAIRACQKIFDQSVPQVAVFDTSFHQSIPKHAYMYAIPYELYEKHHIRKYGFHGTSHRYVSARLSEMMEKPLEELNVITCHLGNGSSLTAVKGGKSVDTTMGFTPLDGVIMGTRCGSIDPSVVMFIEEKEGLTSQAVNDLLNKKSGYAGISGITSDQRDLVAASKEGNARAKLALNMQQYGIKKFIGAYAAAMGGVDAIVFTGGIGENSSETRIGVCRGLQFLGVDFDEAKNVEIHGTEAELTKPGSKVKVFVIPTNEELTIAKDTKALI